ncbi:DUF1515 domain-containing protein [Ensifer adhaerens]|uniref:DUF1515 family protein n=1 Tax=Ensifer adhaerens TaxID=106592 RepID=UPI001CBB5D2C|nr:DUF1515 family protein [Ensifer adhaerens]MBZ7921674.1 DUF1515 domain-containing protein [Ensifer adhaerens]UAX94636.1 DUF1515 domain-containing protein [Ensifer adhaerens]UAY02273.1 DUF1515 domain-containing protein [Ensifer adhaerens]UAY09654.1 DUF1515 domain-containing protein [Ensifer adhaerens]
MQSEGSERAEGIELETLEASVHHQLGILLAEVQHLREDLRKSEDKSDRSRSKMHERVDALVDRIAKLETANTGAQAEIKEMKPVTEQVKKWQLMGMGALGVVGIGGAAMGVTFGDAIRRLLMLLMSK